MKMKKRKLLFIAVILFALISCPFEVPKDSLQSLKRENVFSDVLSLERDGVFEGLPVTVELNFTPEEMMLFDVIVWELKDGFGEIVDSKTETASPIEGAKEGEDQAQWNEGHLFKLDISSELTIGDYKLIVTLHEVIPQDVVEDEEKDESLVNSFSKVFVLDFFVYSEKASRDLKIYGLGSFDLISGSYGSEASQDTGLYKTDGITTRNRELSFCASSTIPQAFASGSKITFIATKYGVDPIVYESSPLNFKEPFRPFADLNFKNWEWKTPNENEFSDGHWLIELRLTYTNEEGAVIDSRSPPFVLIIDTVAPVIKWDYLYNEGSVVPNESNENLTVTDYPIFPWDTLGDKEVENNVKKDFLNWISFSFEDGSKVSKGKENDSFYTGTNFTALNGDEGIMGFSPWVAGVQEISVVAWDLAGNKTVSPSKRRVQISDPQALNKQITNPGFEAVTGIATDNPRPVGENIYTSGSTDGTFQGWKCNIRGYRHSNSVSNVSQDSQLVTFDKTEYSPDDTGPFYHGTNPWNLYFQVWVNNETDKKSSDGTANYAYFRGDNKVQTGAFGNLWTDAWYKNQSGTIYQEGFQLRAHVEYTFSYLAATSRKAPDATAVLARGIIDPVGDVNFSTTGRESGDFILEEVISNVTTENGTWSKYSVSFIPNKTALASLILEKVYIGNADGGWTGFDGVEFAAEENGFPRVNNTSLVD